MTKAGEQSATIETKGRVLHWAAAYDVLVWLITRGRDRQFRQKLLDLARLQAGESVLDVGCGTGTLAIVAKRRVGSAGVVYGIDASAAMINRARKKAAKAGANVVFENALAEALPFPDAHFDVVLSTVMLHHLPRKVRHQCASEMRRVLRAGGRVLAVDFGRPSRPGLISHFHRHGHTRVEDIIALLNAAGLNPIESGAIGTHDLQFVLAERAGTDR